MSGCADSERSDPPSATLQLRWLTCFAGEEIVSWGAPLYVDIRMTETFLTAPPAKEDVLGQSRSDPGSTSEISMLQDGLFAG